MNNDTTTTDTTDSKADRYAALDARLAARKATTTWADKVDLAPIRHSNR